jgi:hypothetical protein
MSCRKKYIRDGTNQEDRQLAALDPSFVQIDGYSVTDRLRAWHAFAEELRYVNEANQVDGNWQDLLIGPAAQQLIAAGRESEAALAPHQALQLVFARMLTQVQDDLNSLSEKHLRFYYEQVLGFGRQSVLADVVHVLVEPTRSAGPTLLPAGSRLQAGKSDSGQPILFETERDLLVTQTQIAALKSIFLDREDHDRAYVAPVANSADGMGKALADGQQHWYGFGGPQQTLPAEAQFMAPAEIGWVVAAPILSLADGTRRIHLTLHCQQTASGVSQDLNIADGLEVWGSGEAEWMAATVESALVQGAGPQRYTLSIQVVLGADAPAVVPLSQSAMAATLATDWPALRVTLRQDSPKYRYAQLRGLQVIEATMEVSVTGKRDLSFQNDRGVLKADSPMLPFGSVPSPGNTFYVGSREVFGKALTAMTLRLHWKDVPAANLPGYYDDYTTTPLGEQPFRVRTELLAQREWEPWQANDADAQDRVGLFEWLAADQPRTLAFGAATLAPAATLTAMDASLGAPLGPFSPKQQMGFLRLVLEGTVDVNGNPVPGLKAFGHQEYPQRYTDAAIEKALGTKAQIPGVSFPAQPYTPLLGLVELDYTAAASWSPGESSAPMTLFHQEPFGYSVKRAGSLPRLLPDLGGDGNLLLGLAGVTPPGKVSLLFQVADGTAVNDPTRPAEAIQWSYFSQGNWRPITGSNLVIDSSHHLQNSGIIELNLGADATLSQGEFGQPLHWIRGSIPEFVAGVNQLVGVYPQAMSARRVLTSDHLTSSEALSLPPGQIQKLLKPLASIKQIQQPFASFGGRAAEAGRAFFTRVSERLRHKQRGVSIWDIEHLVLEAFPSLYKVKCLPHADAVENLVPGGLLVIVVSNLRNQHAVNPLAPKTGFDTLQAVTQLVQQQVSAFAKVQAVNPVYEELLVDFNVGFYPAYDAGYYSERLNEEIQRFLSPWAFDVGEDIQFGGAIRRSDILAFVEERPYVDFVTDFKLYHVYDGPAPDGIGCLEIGDDFVVQDFQGLGIGEMVIEQDLVIGYEVEVAKANSPRAIIVSAPHHRIQVLDPDAHSCVGGVYGGIGFMALEIDFVAA